MITTKQLSIFSAILFLTHACFAAEGGYTVATGGVEIVLSNGWERLDQPINFFVQKRARNAEQGTALSAGSFALDLSLEQYVALGLSGLISSPEAALEQLAKAVGISKEEVDKALASQIGRQLADGLKQASRTMRFELIGVGKREVDGATRFEIHSKTTVIESGQVFFSRQFVMSGSAPRQIVQITFGSTSEAILSQTDLTNAIRLQSKVK